MKAEDKQGGHIDELDDGQERVHPEHEAHHHHHDHEHHHEEPMTPEEAVRSLLLLGEVALSSADYDAAVEAYASALKIEQNENALYNLGSLYARGLGVKKNYVEAARLFHQAELLGNEKAGKLCGKCMLDYLHDGFEDRSAAELYAAMAVFVSQVYPEATDQKAEVNQGLYVVGATHFDKGEYAEAAKVFRAAAEFGGDGYAQYYLGLLYGAGAGLPKNELAALYWLDCAADNGAEGLAAKERDDILDALRQSLSAPEFDETMKALAAWCEWGTDDVPVSPAKALRWYGTK